jgi:hypothetical protein
MNGELEASMNPLPGSIHTPMSHGDTASIEII